MCGKIQRGYLAVRSWCSNDHPLQVQVTLSLVVNITDKVVRSCCQPVVPHLTELSDFFNSKKFTFLNYILHNLIMPGPAKFICTI